jgi:hypothetical protein
VVQAAQHFRVRAHVQPGEVEEGQQVAVADVEEKVRGPLVVPVLDHLGQRELQDALVKADRPFHVRADQGGVVDAPGAADRPLPGLVGIPEPGPLRLEGDQIDRGFRHVHILRRGWLGWRAGPGSGAGPAQRATHDWLDRYWVDRSRQLS